MVFKIVVSDPKSRKAYQKEAEENASGLIGKKVGEKVSGSFLGLEGYELEITGGSDRQGFPMRPDVDGQGRKRIVLAFPPGFHPIRHGERKRKSVRGNTISNDISQINLKIVKAGKKPLETVFGAKEKPKEGEKPVEEKAKPEGKKEAPAGEKGEKPAEAKEEMQTPKEEKPAEEKMGVKTLEEIESPVKETRDISSSKAKEEMKKEKEVEKAEEKGKPAEKDKKKPEKKEGKK